MGATDPKPTVPAGWRAAAVPWTVWSLWAVLTTSLLGYAAWLRSDVPVTDDWGLVGVFTGAEPVTLSWLWEPLNEHRVPIPKLLLLAGARLSGGDYRAASFMSAGLLSALAALLLVTARRLRGRTALADTLFPLVLLHCGQYQVMVIGYAINHVTVTFLAGAALAVLVRSAGRPTAPQALALGTCLTALPLCSLGGLVLGEPLVLWLAAAGWSGLRAGGVRAWRGWLPHLGGAAVAAAVAAVCLVTRPPAPHPPPPSAAAVARTTAEFYAAGLGPAAEWAWPASGLLLLAVAALTGLAALARAGRLPAGQRWRLLGLGAFAVGLAGLGLAVGWGRAFQGPDAGFANRFGVIAAPLLCWLSLAGTLYAPHLAPGLLAALAALALGYNSYFGVWRGSQHRALMHDLARDVRAGKSSQELATTYAPRICSGAPEVVAWVAERFEMLRRARQGPYRGRAD